MKLLFLIVIVFLSAINIYSYNIEGNVIGNNLCNGEGIFNVLLAQNEIEYDDTEIIIDEQQDDTLSDEELFIDDKIRWNKLFETFIFSQDKLVNHPMISISGGVSFNILPYRNNFQSLPNTNQFSLEYGFVRLDSAYKLNRLRYYSSEFVFIEENTNKFGLFESKDDRVYSNLFRFGAGLASGMGMQISDALQSEIYFLHSSSFVWSFNDYANYKPSDFFQSYDGKYKFGNRGAASIEYRITSNFILDINYEHTNMFSGMEYGKWIGIWAIDFVLQRWIDLLDPVLANQIGYSYPFVRFFYKNAISIILSEIRNTHQFYPFYSDYSMLNRILMLKLKFIF